MIRLLIVFIFVLILIVVEKNIEFSIEDLLRDDYDKIIASNSSLYSDTKHKYLELKIDKKVIITFISINGDFFFIINSYLDKIDGVKYKFSTIGEEKELFHIKYLYKYIDFFKYDNLETKYYRDWSSNIEFDLFSIESLKINPNKISFENWGYLAKNDIKKICSNSNLVFNVETKKDKLEFKLGDKEYKNIKRLLCEG